MDDLAVKILYLEPRINDLIIVANACAENGLLLPEFVTERLLHLFGFKAKRHGRGYAKF